MRNRAAFTIFIVVAYVSVYIATLGIRPLFETDEFRYAQIAREILTSGDWVAPHLNGLRYFEKPIFGHWLGAASLWLFGETNFAARLPAALCTGLTGLFICLFTRRFSGETLTGLFAAIIFLSSLAVFAFGTIDILDAILNLFLTLAIGMFFWAYAADNTRERTLCLILAGVACGIAFLTKGFLALVVPVCIIAPFLIQRREWSKLLTLAWLPLLFVIAVALPWSIAIHLREPDFWNYFFWEEHIRRFMADNAQHARPFWFFLAAFPLLVFPWICYLPSAVAGLRKQPRSAGFVAFLLFWFVMPFLFFSASSGKLLPYLLPCLPPFAILMALGLRPKQGSPAAIVAPRATVALLVILLASIVFLLLNASGVAGSPFFDNTETTRLTSLIGALAIGCLICATILIRKPRATPIWIPAAAMLALYLTVPAIIPNSIRNSIMPAAFLTEHQALVDEDAIIISCGAFVSVAAWHFNRDDVYIYEGAGELSYGLSYPDAAGRFLDADSLANLTVKHAGDKGLAIFCPGERAPADVVEDLHYPNAMNIRAGDRYSLIVLPKLQPGAESNWPITDSAISQK